MPGQDTEEIMNLMQEKPADNPTSANEADSAPAAKTAPEKPADADKKSPDSESPGSENKDKKEAPEHDDDKDPVITSEEFQALEQKEQKNKMFGFLKNLKKKKDDDEANANAGEMEKKLNDAVLKIEKLDGKFEMVQSSKSETSERLSSLAEEIGELRSMIYSREEENGKMEDEFEQIKTAASEMKPEKIRKELDEREKETLEVQSTVELQKQKIESLSKQLETQSKVLDKIKSFENMVELADQIKKESEKAKESSKYTDRMAAKTEKLFAEVDERLQEFRTYKKEVEDINEMVKDLITSTDSLEVKSSSLITKDKFSKSQDETSKRLDDFDTRIKTMKDIVSSIIAKLSKGVSLDPTELKAIREDVYGDLKSDIDNRIPADLDRRVEDLECLKVLLKTKIDKVNTIQKTPITTADIKHMRHDIKEDIMRDLDSQNSKSFKELVELIDKRLDKIHGPHSKKPDSKSSSRSISDELLAKKMQKISPNKSNDIEINAKKPGKDSKSSSSSSDISIPIENMEPEQALEKLNSILQARREDMQNEKSLLDMRQGESALDNAELEMSMAKMDLLDGNKKGAMDRLKKSASEISSV